MSLRHLLALTAALTALSQVQPIAQRPTEPTSEPGQDVLTACCGALRYRMIGPFRGGRTKAAAGVPDEPNVFYIGVCNGGVWKTTDYGRTWAPIFDDQPTGSIGAIAVAPSDANIVYVGSGEGLQRPDLSVGDGIYKSTDAGRTWRHLGLRDGQQIPQIVVDPRNPSRLWVAVLGHPYGPNDERGIFRSVDGGVTFQRVLYKDENTGGIDVAIDPTNPEIVYAVLWEARQAPWENGSFRGPGSGLYKSADGGTTWRQVTAGLPTFERDGLGRIGIAVAPSKPARLFATIQADRNGGLYRSEDGGETWGRINANEFVTERGDDFAEVKVDPRNPDIVYSASVVTWKSMDGGKTFTALRGAPGGDDYHRLWINPLHPEIILLASDQGAVITVNGGQTWSSWYNQPTAQFYHVSTDNSFPYRVCGGQQESGSACVASRGDDGRITFRDWHPVGVDEYGYVAPDPLDPDVVYGGRVSRYDRRNGEVQNVAPVVLRGEGAGYRVLRTAPTLFSPIDPKTLYFASNTVWKTADGGRHWSAMSPDLTRPSWDVPTVVGKYRGTPGATPTGRGVVYTLAPSPLDINTMWAGTDDGLIHLTTDGGKTWNNVTPPDVTAWAKVSLIDASHFDAHTAYAAVNTIRLDDLRPHIFRTRDDGRTWAPVTTGIRSGTTVNAVREDPKRRGLLFAGTEQEVYVSFDDGDHWRSLRLNMPASSIRDLVVKDDDLVVATHGRAFWILDDITPLRQADAQAVAADAFLYKPQDTWRVQWNKNTDTPLPPDEPAGQNPPDGAIINYWLKTAPPGPVLIEVLDGAGRRIRRFSSAERVEPVKDIGNWPAYWLRPPQVPPATAGMHRFVWDLRLAPPKAFEFGYPIAATPHDTAPEPKGPWVLPGRYTVKLTAGAAALSQPLVVRMDPRVKTPQEDLDRQFTLSMRLYDAIARVHDAIVTLEPSAPAHVRGNEDPERPDGRPTTPAARLRGLHDRLLEIYGTIQEVDAPPTAAVLSAVETLLRQVDELAGPAPRQ
ncbi:MAG TPA: hypothetical protein VGK32_02975 [Vicinamibacterales bacterium]|jgi:photosystem II stability/assembly factor-like uncharacterized protein